VAGRFPLYTDEDVDGNLVRALRRAGWDLVRALDHHPQRTHDHVHFEHAARLNRVLVANDSDMLKEWAPKWTAQGKLFRGLVWWPRVLYRACRTLAYHKPLCVSLDGFTLHAATRAGAFDRGGREALLGAPLALARGGGRARLPGPCRLRAKPQQNSPHSR
jgi:hypothetical protein